MFASRDLRRLATAPLPNTPKDWEQRMYARFALLPDQAQPLERSWLVAALSVGTASIQLRRICRRFDLGSSIETALHAIARGDCTTANAALADLDATFASRPGTAPLRASSLILAITAALTQHSAYFDAGATA